MADTCLQVLMPDSDSLPISFDFSQLCLLTKNKLLNTMQVNNKFSECVDVHHLQGNTEATGPGSAPTGNSSLNTLSIYMRCPACAAGIC